MIIKKNHLKEKNFRIVGKIKRLAQIFHAPIPELLKNIYQFCFIINEYPIKNIEAILSVMNLKYAKYVRTKFCSNDFHEIS